MERFILPLLLTIVPPSLTALAAWLAHRRKRRRPLIWTGWGLLYATAAFLALIVVGELFSAQGLLMGAVILAPWVISLAALGVLAVRAPRTALTVLALLAVLPVGLATWEAFDPLGASSWADSIGPVELVLIYVLAVIVGLTAGKAPREAGWVLLLVAGVPIVLRVLTPAGELARQVIIASLSMPAATAGVAFLLASRHAPAARRPRRAPDRSQRRLQPGSS